MTPLDAARILSEDDAFAVIYNGKVSRVECKYSGCAATPEQGHFDNCPYPILPYIVVELEQVEKR